jgi:hypothetical protein
MKLKFVLSEKDERRIRAIKDHTPRISWPAASKVLRAVGSTLPQVEFKREADEEQPKQN